MKSQPINSFLCSDALSIDISETMRKEMEKQGCKFNPIAMPIPSVADIKIKHREPMMERELSTEEFLNLFDRKESLVMAYVPHFITQCVIHYLDLMTDYMRTNRLSEYKKNTRQLREIKEEYLAALRHEMPPHVFQKFLDQRDEYLASCGSNLQLMYFTFGNQMLKHYGRMAHEDVFCYANIIIAFIEFVEDFDREVNKKIAERMKMPCRNHGDARLTAIKHICKDIIKPYPLEKNEQTSLCVGVMKNKAVRMINAMMEESN